MDSFCSTSLSLRVLIFGVMQLNAEFSSKSDVRVQQPGPQHPLVREEAGAGVGPGGGEPRGAEGQDQATLGRRGRPRQDGEQASEAQHGQEK